MNIIWKQPNETLAITSIFDGSNPQEHAQVLLDRGDIPTDWVLIGTGMEWSSDTRWAHETYRYVDGFIVPDLSAAKEETKKRLRAEREPLLAQLDIQFQRNLETNADNTAVIAEKQRLRDITNLVDNATLDELLEITCQV